MKFILHKASSDRFKKEIEISSLEELMALIDEYDSKLIIDKDEIWVYDDYME